MKTRKQQLNNVKRIIVKVGTSTLTHSTGLLNLSRIENIVRQLANIHNSGVEVILVTSGAIGAGIGKLGLKERPKTIPEKQAAAAVGQGVLIHMYEKFLSEYGKIGAQLLLTQEDTSDRDRFLNIRNTFFALLDSNVIPIINENDAIVVDEIKFGDNDTLSAMVASVVDADLLILLTDIDGLYDSNPCDNPNANLISTVENIDDKIVACASGSNSKLGTGGMTTKIKAAEIARASGIPTIIANGQDKDVLNKIMDCNKIGTLFIKEENHLNAKKHWLKFSTKPSGTVLIDKGAQYALVKKHKSLLPKGIVSVEGIFNEGDIISVCDLDGNEIARGLANYNSKNINLIMGLNSDKIEENIGFITYRVVIHTNNMVLL